MVATVSSAGILGIDGYIVSVECDLSGGLPTFDVVGLPDASVREARDRVRAAIKNCGYDFPLSRVTVNLAPADTKKEGSVYDLPILLGILAASGQISKIPSKSVFLGELSLGGELRSVSGALSMALAAEHAGCDKLFLPAENAEEASFAERIAIYPVEHVSQLLAHLSGHEPISPYIRVRKEPEVDFSLDFSHVMGQENVKRALEIAAAGGHNVLMLCCFLMV